MGLRRYDSDFDYVGDFADHWNDGMRRARFALGVFGVVLALLGVACAVDPMGIYAFVQGVIAAALIIGGVGALFTYARTPELFRSPVTLVMGVLNALLGLMLLALPAYLTAGTIAFLLAFLFIISGVEHLSFSGRMRYFELPHSGLTTLIGVLNIVAGVALLLMPVAFSLVIGYVVAAYLIVGGVTLVIDAVSMRRIER